MNTLLGTLCRCMQIMQRARTDFGVPLCSDAATHCTLGLIRCRPGQGVVSDKDFWNLARASQPTPHVSLAPGASSADREHRAAQGESLETSEGDASSSKRTHFIVWVRPEERLGAVVAVVVVVSRRTRVSCATRTPQHHLLQATASVSSHPCPPRPSVRLSSDALYTPDLAPFCS